MNDLIPGRFVQNGIILFVGLLVLLAFFALPVSLDVSQTGFRGTGMANVVNANETARLASVNVLPESEAPIVPEADAPLAKDIYENVQVLGDLTEDNFNRLMLAITEWVSPEQGCAYCHGEDGNFAHDDIYAKVVSRSMLLMTRDINANWQDHVKATGVTCYTCHRGQNVPSQIWFAEPAGRAGMSIGADSAQQNLADARVAYASLPRDAFSRFLVEPASIRVNTQSPRATPEGALGIKDAEWTYGLMMHFSSALGANCTVCHNSRNFGSWNTSPTQRVTAWHGINMVRHVNADYLVPLQPVYPAHRLGPTGDAPKANCATCHQGAQKPLLGQSMLPNWPELATTGAPVYATE